LYPQQTQGFQSPQALTNRVAIRLHTRNRRFLGTPTRVFAVRLHTTWCSSRDIQKFLRLFGVRRSHKSIW